ncbi:NADP-dependent oxidoreductase domain-containing protein [Roridomyces roridus]|uniref:NADP-dependent oxidoreductase domain-containing protein n=1 Tax=Roridomyces roridus TaxID=1738132 RepID=A0AAD7BN03_9AGAR|nr:NADP-dependent oxidoreductase domain-containing protein [Roridomyces roridus]
MSAPAKMKYVHLGNSGLKISKIVFGCMSYGSSSWANQGWILGEEVGIEHIKAAYDAGINAFDTAAVYSDGQSEEILGKAIKQHNLPRDEIVVMTKLFGYSAWNKIKESEGGRTTNQRGLSRKHVFDSVRDSLKRLQLEYIDLLQCHRFDYDTPIEETMQALHDVVKAGYVRYIGMSSCWAYQFNIMQNYAATHNLTPFISMQNHHSLVYREEEREMFPTLKHYGVGIIPWSPLARGVLTRPLAAQKETSRGTADPWVNAYNKGGYEAIVNRVEEIAKKRGVSMAQIALAWSMSKDGVTAPIIGATSLEKLADCIAAVNLELTAEEKTYLEEQYVPIAVFGHT